MFRNTAAAADDVRRDSVSRSDARALLAERRETVAAEREAAARKHEALEREAEHMPPDVAPAAAMLQSAQDARPKRMSVLEEALANDSGLTFHSLAPTSDECRGTTLPVGLGTT